MLRCSDLNLIRYPKVKIEKVEINGILQYVSVSPEVAEMIGLAAWCLRFGVW
ncbi:hypothetical protein [Kingella negevensis]|uniref:hypothetical protein n=1 Tax=Kingella negevensis TaxID=1522312 RepID=UPI000A54E506|nr:hypothetical protein [Kingella negevensis]MDK4687731.1 hypothetical protein [Kingella negevensis]WII91274.1 hypothetical protein QEO93_01375 [Kingella negevensis]